MVVKIYVSGISGNKEVKKRQQRVLMILDSRVIKYEIVDIAEPGNETEKDFMQNNSTSLGATVSDTNPRHPLPPQIFNDDTYCGDYDQFDMANEIDELEKFLKTIADSTAPVITSNAEIKLGNGNINADVDQTEGDTKDEILTSTVAADIIKPENEHSLQTEQISSTENNCATKMENGENKSEFMAPEEP